MKHNNKLLLLIAIPFLGILAGYLLMGRTVTIEVNGEMQQIFTRALTVQGALRTAGYTLQPEDQVSPSANGWLSKTTTIELHQARVVNIWVDPDGEFLKITTAGVTPEEILSEAGFEAIDGDVVRMDGKRIQLDEEIDIKGSLTLQYTPAIEISVRYVDSEETLRSAAANIGLALWENGYRLTGGETEGIDLEEKPVADRQVEIPNVRLLEVSVDGLLLPVSSSAGTVGQALTSAGISLQDLDFVIPGERNPLPNDGKVQVIRVREEVIYEQSTLPYEVQRVADDSLPMTEESVVKEGKSGIKASRVRVRFENGVEVSRKSEADIVLVQSEPRVIRYGTQLVGNAIDTPYGVFTYYLAVNATATSYSPCRSGVPGKCYYSTAYGIPVTYGVVAVHREWYNILKGTKVYVPGYGVGIIADTGYYPYNHNWIDLGYSDEDWVGWGALDVTIYFLTPPPAGFSGVLP